MINNAVTKKIMLLAAVCSAVLPVVAHSDVTGGDGQNGRFVDGPEGLPDGRNEAPSFSAGDLIKSSFAGMLDESCGGYCVIGACAHLNTGFSIKRGVYFYTIISPKIRHGLPDLLVSSYNHVGSEPFSEWRNTFGLAVSSVNVTVGSVVGSPLGLDGGRADPINQDTHQSTSYKEVDIIGHPMTILPDLVNTDGSMGNSKNYTLKAPAVTNINSTFQNAGELETEEEGGMFDGINIQEMLDGTWQSILDTIAAEIRAALSVLKVLEVIDEIYELVQYVKAIAELMEAISMMTEVAVRSTFYANFINPRFQVPRLFCPSSVAPLQPYYLTFADSFWWRSGYPITDGPFSGSDHSGDILNPVSNDTLPTTANPYNLLDEVWGNLYPREGAINSSHDAKTAAVTAWRAMDVLLNDVKNSNRTGIPLPGKLSSVKIVEDPKWQLIYPEVRSCQSTPYYPSDLESVTKDFMEPSGFGGYAWNYYRTYTCCSNTEGTEVGSFDFPIPLCLSFAEINDVVQEDREEYEERLERERNDQ